MTTRQWVERLGGYVRLAVEERREAAAELRAEGMSTWEIGDVLGVGQTQVRRDLDDPSAEPYGSTKAEPERDGEPNGSPDEEPAPLDAVAALAADEKVRRQAEKDDRRQAEGHMADDWYTYRQRVFVAQRGVQRVLATIYVPIGTSRRLPTRTSPPRPG